METYKQSIKEESREKIWEHAIYSLTTNRSSNRILKEEYIRNLWNYIFYKSKYSQGYFEKYEININYLNSWCEFANNCYGYRSANELRVVYLCGPEPENDLEVLLKLGVRIENIWAVENRKDIFNSAIENIRNKYPMLKIFNGTIDSFFELYPMQFDIIYLDFTTPIFSKKQSPFKTIHKIFDNQVLSEMGILITNYPMPEKTKEYVDFLSDFFFDQRYIEGGVHGGIASDGSKLSWFGDGRCYYGWTRNDFNIKIDENFEGAYSSFCSLYPILYSNAISPAYRVVRRNNTYKKIFNSDSNIIENLLMELYKNELIIEEGLLSEVGFFKRLEESKSTLASYWFNYYSQKESGDLFNRVDALRFVTILRMAFSTRKEKVLSESMRQAVMKAYEKMKEYENKRLFCDVIFKDILSEIALNQLGFPYHSQMFNHKRFSYKAKTMKMFVDIFTFDRCRAFYDWIPFIEFYGESLQSIERQMILRCCVDAIGGKQLCFTPIPVYSSGVNVIGMFEAEWAKFVNSFPERKELE